MKREIAALAAVLVLGVGGYYGYDAYLGTLPKTIVKVKPVWFSLEDPRGKTFDWAQYDTDCIFVKVKAIAPPKIDRGLGDTASDPSLRDQKLLVVDTLGQNYLVNSEGDDKPAPLVKGDGHVVEVHFRSQYKYSGSTTDPKAKAGWVTFLYYQKQGKVEIADRSRRDVTLRVMGQGEPPPIDQISYVCLEESVSDSRHIAPGDETMPQVAHYIHSYFKIVE